MVSKSGFSKYGFWLAGYYDDFTGCRTIPDDSNVPSATALEDAYARADTHHGNPLNGEAPLNPRYRWSYHLREQIEGHHSNRPTGVLINNGSGYSAGTAGGTAIVTDGEDADDHFAVGDKVYGNDNALVGTILSVSANEIKFREATASALADDEELQNGNSVLDFADSRYLHNRGIGVWATKDIIRLGAGANYEGKAQLQYPCSIVNANRQRYNRDSNLDSYMLMSHYGSSLSYYTVPLGTFDSSFGGAALAGGTGANAGAEATGLPVTLNGTAAAVLSDDGDYEQGHRQDAHLAGVFAGERSGGDFQADTHKRMFRDITAPSGQPFLVLSSKLYQGDDYTVSSSTRPIIAYNGSLNSRGDKDVFTIRFAFQSGGGVRTGDDGVPPHIEFHIGYNTGITFSKEFGFTTATASVPAIKWKVRPSPSSATNSGLSSTAVHYHEMFEGNAARNATEDDMSNVWHDLDFIMDYTNGTYQVYHNGTQVTTDVAGSSPSGGNFTLGTNAATSATYKANEMFGWQAVLGTNAADSDDYYSNQHLLIDRVGLVRPLTDHPKTGEIDCTVQNMRYNSTTNGISSMVITVNDDVDYASTSTGDSADQLPLTNILTDDTNSDWKLMMFNDNIDRPTWCGVIERIDITQKATANTTDISIRARDNLSLLDRQMPMWEIGQAGMGDTETVVYRREEVEKLMDALYMGAAKLKVLDKSIGFEATDSYVERVNQRTSLYSAHPIQIYNNEDDFGPNNAEVDWQGYGFDGVGVNAAGNEIQILVSGTGSDFKLPASNITVSGTTNYDGTYAIINVIDNSAGGTVSGHSGQILEVATSVKGYTADSVKVTGASDGMFGANNGSSTYFIHFNADPNLKYGQKFVIPNSQSGIDDIEGLHICLGTLTDGTNFSVLTNTTYTGNDYPSSGTISKDFCKESGYVTGGNSTDVTTASRDVHAVWMRDICQNPWFKFIFATTESKFVASAFPTTSIAAAIPTITQDGTFRYTDTLAHAITPTTTSIQLPSITNEKYIPSGPGVAQIITIDGKTGNPIVHDEFIYGGVRHASNVSYLCAVKGITHSHSAYSAGTNEKYIAILDLSRDFKHCWVLWSDMRNSGDADADGGWRKNDFGLLYPTTDNYELSLSFVDQYDEEGNLDKFLDLKLGVDYDIWSLDAEKSPYNQSPWSLPMPATESTTKNSDSLSHTDSRWSDSATKFHIQKAGTIDSNGGFVRFSTGAALGASSGLAVGDKIIVHRGGSNHVANWSDTYSVVHTVTAVASSGVSEKITTDIAYVNAVTSTYNNSTSCINDGPFFSKVYDATNGPENSTNTLSQYQDWEDKGGSFVIIDFSKFFNMNTRANGRRVGSLSGGRTDLGDYITEQDGFPEVIDNYWAQALSNPITSDPPIKEHENWPYVISDAAIVVGVKNPMLVTSIANLVTVSGTIRVVAQPDAYLEYAKGGVLELTDASDFSTDGGSGLIRATLEDSNEDSIFIWKGSNQTKRTGTITGHTKGSDTDATYTYITIVDSSATFQTWGIQPGMLFKLTHADSNKSYGRVHSVTNNTTLILSTLAYQTDAQITAGLHHGTDDTGNITNNTDTYEIPIQLFGCEREVLPFTNPLTTQTTNTVAWDVLTGYPEVTENDDTEARIWLSNYIAFNQRYDNMKFDTGDFWELTYRDPSDSESAGFDQIVAYNSVGNTFGSRLILTLDGYIRAPDIGTFWESDKFRAIWNLGMAYSWLQQTDLNCMFDINNIPNTKQMTNSGTSPQLAQTGETLKGRYADTTDEDNYGSVTDVRNKTILQAVKEIQVGAGVGYSNSVYKTFSYLQGRDGRIEFRPKYNSGFNFTRDNLLVSDLTGDLSGAVTNVRVFYNGGASFSDFPTATLTTKTKWKIIEVPEVTNGAEAQAIAKTEYEKVKKPALKITAEPIRDLTLLKDDKMIYNGRYGYIADTYIANDPAASDAFIPGQNSRHWYWTSPGGAGLFAGMCNGLDGNMNTFVDGDINYYKRFGSSKSPNTSLNGISRDEAYYWWGSKSVSHAVQLVNVPNGTNKASTETGEKLRVAVSVGARSESPGGTQNVFGNDVENTQFYINFIDCSYRKTSASSAVSPDFAATLGGSSAYSDIALEAIPVRGSGFYEIWIPTTYQYSAERASNTISFDRDGGSATNHGRISDSGNGLGVFSVGDVVSVSGSTNNDTFYYKKYKVTAVAGDGSTMDVRMEHDEASADSVGLTDEAAGDNVVIRSYYGKFVVSFNREYCEALLRRRCGGTQAAGHTGLASLSLNAAMYQDLNSKNLFVDTSDVGSGTSFNTDSIFPLGLRQYSELGKFTTTRSVWYAPRINIVDDINFVPGTFVKYTDKRLGMDDESLVIQDISWSVNQRNVEQLRLGLERNESRIAGSLSSYLSPTVNKGRGKNVGARGQAGHPGGPGGSGGDSSGGSTGGSGGGGFGRPGSPSWPPGSGTGGRVGQDDFVPLNNRGRTTSVAGGETFSKGQGINSTSATFANRIKGRADLLTDVGLSSGGLSIPGQKKGGGAIVSKATNSDITIMPSAGISTLTEEGFILSGAVNVDQTGESPTYKTEKHTVTVKSTIRDDVANNIVYVNGIVSLAGTTTQFASVDVKVTCENASGVISTFEKKDIRIHGNTERGLVSLVKGVPMKGADKPNNTIKIEISRHPATSGSVDPFLNSIVFHSVDVKYSRASVKGKSKSSNFGGASRQRRTF